MTSVLSPEIAASLQSASTLLRSGRHEAGRNLLRSVLSAQPGLIEAHWLLAISLFETGELDDAQRALQIVLRENPNHASARALSGRILLSTGQLQAAVRTFQQALELNPNPSLAADFARLLLAQANAEEAIEVIAPLLQMNTATPELLLLHGHALMTLGRAAEAVFAFEKLVRLAPSDGEAKVRLAAALSDSGRHLEAEVYVRKGIAQGAQTPEADFVLGRALIGQGRLQAAEPALRDVVRRRPDHVTAQANLSELIWMRTGDVTEASREIDVALRLFPQLSQLRIAKANLLLAAGEYERALRQVEEGIDPKTPMLDLLRLHVAAAQIALETDAHQALEHARQALRLDSTYRLALTAYGDALLAIGEAAQAIQVATKLLEGNRYDGRAIALLASAARMKGDPIHQELLDYHGLVLTQHIDVPPGWTTLAEYLSELAGELLHLHSSSVHPVGRSLRLGSQVELDLERAVQPAIRAFGHAIDAPIRRYLAHVGQGGDPLRSRNKGGYRMKGAWSVRLRANGFHVNHHHPEGWVSSACYIQVPEAVNSPGREGWLKFGEPGFSTDPPLSPEHFVRPEPGLLTLFPSYMWHGTTPFPGRAEESRLTIAFDLLPA